MNLVPNPSFEDTVSCPINGFITNCQGWQPYSSSPDYFNGCVPSWYVYGVPDNYFGSQPAASGQAYAGIFCYVEGETDYSIDREILGNNLLSALTIGQKYYVSFKVALTLNTQNTGSSLGINKLGVLFSSISYTNLDSTTIPPIANFAHVYTDSIITDSTNWTTVFGSFVADSAYTNISIGNFFKVTNTDTIHVIANNPFTPNAYYYVDDICVSTDSSFCTSYLYAGVENERMINEIDVYPNPSTGLVKIKMPDMRKNTSVSVINVLGQIFYNAAVVENESLDLGFLDNGVYTIVLKSSSNQYSTKLLIHK